MLMSTNNAKINHQPFQISVLAKVMEDNIKNPLLNPAIEQFQRKLAPAKAGVETGFASGIAPKQRDRAFQAIQPSPEML